VESLELRTALLKLADHVENEVAHASVAKSGDGRSDIACAAERAITVGGLAEVHRIADREVLGRCIQGHLPGAAEANEQEMASAEALQWTPRLRHPGGKRDIRLGHLRQLVGDTIRLLLERIVSTARSLASAG
jgi:hypothetical protein